MQSVNPATGEVIRRYDPMSEAAMLVAAETAQLAFQDWREREMDERARLMKQAAHTLKKHKERYGRLISEEMGKIRREAEAEIDKCAWVCDYYAEHAAHFLADIPIKTEAGESFVSFQPLGPVLAVMPWNFPFWQVFRFAAPALMAGNAVLLKHASNVCGCALAIERLFQEAGFPENLFRTLLVPSDAVSALIGCEQVRAVTLTGSTQAGRAVAARAGQCLKKTVLELGGSDAYVVLGDADIAQAVSLCVKSRLLNAGQSCIAAKRFIVEEAVIDDFLTRFKEAMAALRMGEPSDEASDLGPLASREHRDTLHRQVRASIDNGARALLGGQLPEGAGAYYPPTILTDVAPGMPAYEEELFGPVAAVIRVKDADEAIRVANDSPFGLGAAVFSGDPARARDIARNRLEAGACFVNDFVKSDPRLPFGGVKDSGYGRELSSFGIREFVNVKTVSIA